MYRLIPIFVIALGCNAHAVNVAPLTELVGDAYDLDSGELLYREHHEFDYASGLPTTSRVEYRRPDGSVIGHKTLDFRPNLFVPEFRTELYGGRYIEGLRHRENKLELYRRQGENSERESKTIKRRDQMTGDAGFNPYVQSRFDELMRGDTVQFYIAAPNKLDSYKFEGQRIDDSTIDGMPVVNFKVKFRSLFSFLVDPLELSYDPETRYLIEYRGLSNVRDEAGELYETRIRYPSLIRRPAASE